MWQGQKKNDGGLFWYFQTCRLKYSPVGAWLVHIRISVDMELWFMSLNHLGGLSLRKSDVLRALAKGRKPDSARKIFLSWSSRSSRKLCHSLSAMVSTLVRAEEWETNRGRRYLESWHFMLAAACAFLSVIFIWSRPPWPGVQRRVPVILGRKVNSLTMFFRNMSEACWVACGPGSKMDISAAVESEKIRNSRMSSSPSIVL